MKVEDFTVRPRKATQNVLEKKSVKRDKGDFPGGLVVKNLSCNAGDVGSIPGPVTNIPHAPGQISPSAATTEPSRHNYRAHVLWSPRTTIREKPAHRN